jgi:curved DNA-binding protein CbpA
MATTKNYYSILGVEPTARQEEIRSSYILRSRVLHPDRFDPVRQPTEWNKANEMLAELNEAYSVLRDEKRRASYDLQMGYKAAQPAGTGATTANTGARPNTTSGAKSDTKRQASSGNKQAGGAARPGGGSRTYSTADKAKPKGVSHYRFDDLPMSTKEKLLKRQHAESEQFKVATETYLHMLVPPTFALGWLGIVLWLSDSAKWSGIKLGFLGGLTLISALTLAWAAMKIYRWHTSSLKPNVIITPLYYIKTHFDEVAFWWLWDIQDHRVVHNHRNGQYQNTKMIFGFHDSDQNLYFSNKKQVAQLVEKLSEWERRYKVAVNSRDMDYFLSRDDFIELREHTPPIPGSNGGTATSRARMFIGYAAAAALAVAWMVLAFNLNIYYDDKRAWNAAVLLNKATSYRDYLKAYPAGLWRGDAQTRIALLYDASAKQYVGSRATGFDERASDAVLELLNYAKVTNNYHVTVAFSRKNEIPERVEEQMKRRFGVKNVLPVGSAFSDYSMKARESSILSTVQSAFKQVIAEDVLEFGESRAANNDGPVLLVSYTVKAGDALYYRERDSLQPETYRPFYPGIFFDWNFEIRLPSRDKSYEFALKSKPANQFSGSEVYEGMTHSAFEDFRGELVRRLGLRY